MERKVMRMCILWEGEGREGCQCGESEQPHAWRRLGAAAAATGAEERAVARVVVGKGVGVARGADEMVVAGMEVAEGGAVEEGRAAATVATGGAGAGSRKRAGCERGATAWACLEREHGIQACSRPSHESAGFYQATARTINRSSNARPRQPSNTDGLKQHQLLKNATSAAHSDARAPATQRPPSGQSFIIT